MTAKSLLAFPALLAVAACLPAADPSKPLTVEEIKGSLLKVGQAAPAFEVADPSGNKTSLKGLLKDNKAVVVTFWCLSCGGGQDVPAMQAFHERVGGRGVGFIALERDGKPETVAAFLEKAKATFPVGCQGGPVGKTYDTKRDAFPFTFVIAPDGKIVWVSDLAGFYPFPGQVGKHLTDMNAALRKLGVDLPDEADRYEAPAAPPKK